jgi:hypothetical protein
MIKRWVSLVGLGLVLVGFPLVIGACADLTGDPATPTYAPNGSLHSPYPVTVSKGTCAAWKIAFANIGGNPPYCAQRMPTQQVGTYVQLSYGSISQEVQIVSIDSGHQIVRVL